MAKEEWEVWRDIADAKELKVMELEEKVASLRSKCKTIKTQSFEDGRALGELEARAKLIRIISGEEL